MRPPHVVGGIYDTAACEFVRPTEDPQIWLVGERQAEILLDRDPVLTRTLLYSAEGAGKTVLMAQWLVLQALLLAQGGEIGNGLATAPTNDRLQTLIDAVCERCPVDSPRARRVGSWGTYFIADRELRFHHGVNLIFRATKKASAAVGSPIQGITAKFSGDDELQDTAENGADPDIEARLRGARTSRRMCTATAKDSPGWRTFRDGKETSPNWTIQRLRYTDTPFIWPEHWSRMQQEMSAREWQRRGLAMDVGPERQLYYTWDRQQNLMQWPCIGARDVTSKVLGDSKYGILVGHDPGRLQDVSVMLKAVQLRGERRHRWVVVDELTTKQTTSEQHFAELMHRLRTKWDIHTDGQIALVRCDPYGTRGEEKPDRSVYLTAKKAGFDIRSAAYKNGKGSAQIPKEARIEMVIGLLRSASEESWLYVGSDDSRRPLADRTVYSLESSARDEMGRAEAATKYDKSKDLSDHTAALGYALWPYERVAFVKGIQMGAAIG